MSKKKRRDKTEVVVLGLNESNPSGRSGEIVATDAFNVSTLKRFTCYLKAHWIGMTAIIFVLFLGLGVMAKNDWLPRTDPLSGKRTGWFGKEIPKNTTSSWNPFSIAFTTPTPPQMSKEYVYAGSRLLTVEDANADAVPPTDLAVWRPSTGGWHIYNSENLGEEPTVVWGQEGDTPILGDYDGDGKTDFSYYRSDEFGGNNEWHIQRSSDGTDYIVSFSLVGLDTPAVGDFDGDGKTDLAAWKSIGTSHPWKIQYSSTGATITTASFGSGGDKPVPADYDGDGKADLAVWRSSNHTFYWKSSLTGQDQTPVSFGSTGDIPVCADYDGDGKANFALKQGASWIIMNAALNSTTTTTPSNWPYSASDIAVQNDYDDDGIADIAVWRLAGKIGQVPRGYWSILQSHNQTTRTTQFGESGDIPVPAYYRRH